MRDQLALPGRASRLVPARARFHAGRRPSSAHDDDEPVARAQHAEHVEALALLLDRGAAVDASDAEGVTPLFVASMGGGVEAALKRAGRYFNGWFPSGAGTVKEWTEGWKGVQQFAKDAGRDPDSITGAAYVTIAVNDDQAKADAELDGYLANYYLRENTMVFPSLRLMNKAPYSYRDVLICSEQM